MSKPKPLIAGNWKMNGQRFDGLALAEAIRAGAGGLEAELLLCPPATLIAAVGEKIKGSGIALGGQDCHWAASGAHTGDIAAPMLADLGCRYVILGHSERRHGHGETDAMVKAKAEAALAAGLIAIVCLGKPKRSATGARPRGWLGASWRARCPGEPVRTRWSLPMSLSGPSAPAGPLATPISRPSMAFSGAILRQYSPKQTASGCFMAARSSRVTARESWRSPMSMGRWSGEPA